MIVNDASQTRVGFKNACVAIVSLRSFYVCTKATTREYVSEPEKHAQGTFGTSGGTTVPPQKSSQEIVVRKRILSVKIRSSAKWSGGILEHTSSDLEREVAPGLSLSLLDSAGSMRPLATWHIYNLSSVLEFYRVAACSRAGAAERREVSEAPEARQARG